MTVSFTVKLIYVNIYLYINNVLCITIFYIITLGCI